MLFFVAKKPFDYSLFTDCENHVLLVSCGSVAVYELAIALNDDEKENYLLKGLSYIDELAKKIQYSPKSYANRNIVNFSID